jgi:hypothetical protein
MIFPFRASNDRSRNSIFKLRKTERKFVSLQRNILEFSNRNREDCAENHLPFEFLEAEISWAKQRIEQSWPPFIDIDVGKSDSPPLKSGIGGQPNSGTKTRLKTAQGG